MYFIGPLAIVLILMILFALYGNCKFPVTIALGVIMTEPHRSGPDLEVVYRLFR
jgi:heavy metal efflux system protein